MNRRWARALLVATLAVAALLGARPATAAPVAQPEPPAQAAQPENARAEAAALLADAERAERELRFADALRLYRASFARDPSAPSAPRARVRAEDLAAHAEGDFAPLATLERARRDPALASSREAVERLEADVATFPAGRVRTEARLLAGGAWTRLGEPRRAADALAAVVADAGADRVSRAMAMGQLAAALERAGDLAAARSAVLAYPDVAPPTTTKVLRAWRRRWLRGGAVAVAGSVVALGLASLAALARAGGPRAAGRALASPLVAAVAAWIALAGAALVRAYDESDPRPFLLLGAGALVVGVAARAWGLAAARRVGPRMPRAARAVLCAAAVVAVAFLALDASDPAYLDSFRL